ncbi:DNA mismatch repair protein Msh3 [Gryllus bimaculatus]|nr:DNA mismatch repair protein Msh3 [Gryllus bimaculatus]
MFNPLFVKYRRKNPSAQRIKKITSYFEQQQPTTSQHGNEESKRLKVDSATSSTKETLSKFARKRRSDNEPTNSAKTKKQLEVAAETQGPKLTPFEQQILQLRHKHPGMVLIIQSGYKYYLYGEDAEVASRVLRLEMYPNHNFMRSSFPVERLHVHARKLVEAGYKVGVIQQQEVAELKAISDNKNKVFDRELTAIYTKGTAIGEDILFLNEYQYFSLFTHLFFQDSENEIDPLNQSVNICSEEASANFILCVAEVEGNPSKPNIGLVAFDVASGEAYFDHFVDNPTREELEKRVEHLTPAEVLIPEKLSSSSAIVLKHSKARLEVLPEEKFNFSAALIETAAFLSKATGPTESITNLPAPVVCSLSALLSYLKSCNVDKTLRPENLQHFSKNELYVQLDGATIRNLEIFKSSSETHHGSLFWLFDQYAHPRFGSRVLREWLSRPLRDIETLRRRQDAVAELLHCSSKSVVELHSILQKIPDLEHGLTAILLGRSTPSSVYIILQNLRALKLRLEAIIGASDVVISSPLLRDLITESASLLSNILQFLNNMNEDAARNASRKGDVTNFLNDYSNFPAVLNLQTQIRNVENQLDKLLPDIAKKIGLRTAKYTSVHGVDYLTEVKVKQCVPDNWIKVNETKHVSRYHTSEVLPLRTELNILKAQLKQECQNSWRDFIDCFNVFYADHKKAVKNIAILDALIALSQLARSDGYCRPELVDDDIVINIQRGKHPIVSKFVNDFVPNNTYLECPENLCMVLSGPNMGGKSCYVRQVALIAIMALIGSYVPAEYATIGTLDAIYTRIGAQDEIFKARSTLMMEMEESSRILHKATRRSLVLMDELGRGTSSHDGAAIAAATLSHLINKVQCLTLFITHFPSVMDVVPHYNFSMGFHISKFGKESESELLTFLYVVQTGKASHSYGVNVSRLAGIPKEITDKALIKAEQLQANDEIERSARHTFLNLWKACSVDEIKSSFA